MEARAVLASIPFFAEVLNEGELAALAGAAVTRDFEGGAAVIREQDPTDSLFVIASGTVSVTIHDRAGEKQVATLGPGEIVGEMSMLTGAPRAATVVATAPVEALEISRGAMKSLLAASPHLFARFGEMLHKRQVELDRLYGKGFWARFAPPRENYASLIRRHLG